MWLGDLSAAVWRHPLQRNKPRTSSHRARHPCLWRFHHLSQVHVWLLRVSLPTTQRPSPLARFACFHRRSQAGQTPVRSSAPSSWQRPAVVDAQRRRTSRRCEGDLQGGQPREEDEAPTSAPGGRGGRSSARHRSHKQARSQIEPNQKSDRKLTWD